MKRFPIPNRRLWQPAQISHRLCAPVSPLLAAEKQDGYRLLELEGYPVKCGEQQSGTAATISYAFMDETLAFENARAAAR